MRLVRTLVASALVVVVFAALAGLALAQGNGPPGGCTPPGQQYGGSAKAPSADQYGPPGLGGGCPPGLGKKGG